jgi:hypothetical protein
MSLRALSVRKALSPSSWRLISLRNSMGVGAWVLVVGRVGGWGVEEGSWVGAPGRLMVDGSVETSGLAGDGFIPVDCKPPLEDSVSSLKALRTAAEASATSQTPSMTSVVYSCRAAKMLAIARYQKKMDNTYRVSNLCTYEWLTTSRSRAPSVPSPSVRREEAFCTFELSFVLGVVI